MNSIFRIYESLLGKTSDKVQKVNLESVAMAGNEPDSELRRFFTVSNWHKEPFSVDGKTFVYTVDKGSTPIWSPEKNLTDIIGNRFDCVRIRGLVSVEDTNVGVQIHKNLEAEEIRFDTNCVLEDVTIKTIAGNKYYPIILLRENIVKNSTLEIDYSKAGESFGYIRSIGIPTFINVKSDTIPAMRIEANPFGDSIMAFDGWDKIFEFGYKLGYRTSELDKFKFTTVKSMDDIFKLCKSKQFRVREYDQFPYKLKKGVKLSDIIDISKFKNLKQVVFTNHVSKMFQITFEKVDMCSDKMSIVTKWPTSILIQQRKEYIFGRPDLMLKDVPVTADGWRVLINGE